MSGRISAHALFGFAWALAALFHQQWDAARLPPPLGVEGIGGWVSLVVPTLAAFALLLRPWSGRRLVVLCAVQLLDVLWWLPNVSNHYLLMGLADATLLAAFAGSAAAGRGVAAEDAFGRARPFLRLLVVVLYGFAFFWKLNPDFIDPATSCAVFFYQNIHSAYGLLPGPESVGGAVVAATLWVEGCLPWLLCWRRTRAAAALGAALFHFGLALDPVQGFYNFSAPMYALLLLFFDRSAGRAFAEHFPGWVRRGFALRTGVAAIFATSIAAALWLSGDALVYHSARYVLWQGYGLFALVVGVVLVRAGSAGRDSMLPAWRSALWVFPLLALLNGCAPWLGLKTRSSWQMYSNVRIEAEASNHWIVPGSLDLFGRLGDSVRVLETDDPGWLRQLLEEGFDVPYHQLRVYTSAHPDIGVSFERDGRRYAVERVGDHPELGVPPGLLERKVFWFRPLGPAMATRCGW